MDNQISQIVIIMAATAALPGRATNLKHACMRAKAFFAAIAATSESSCSLWV